jgi:hypothetical protein
MTEPDNPAPAIDPRCLCGQPHPCNQHGPHVGSRYIPRRLILDQPIVVDAEVRDLVRDLVRLTSETVNTWLDEHPEAGGRLPPTRGQSTQRTNARTRRQNQHTGH